MNDDKLPTKTPSPETLPFPSHYRLANPRTRAHARTLYSEKRRPSSFSAENEAVTAQVRERNSGGAVTRRRTGEKKREDGRRTIHIVSVIEEHRLLFHYCGARDKPPVDSLLNDEPAK